MLMYFTQKFEILIPIKEFINNFVYGVSIKNILNFVHNYVLKVDTLLLELQKRLDLVNLAMFARLCGPSQGQQKRWL